MATERQANEASTTLNGAVLAGATTITVTSAAGFPALPLFRVRVSGTLTAGGNGTEYMQVNTVAGTTWTVTRASEAPFNVALGFNSGAAVDHVMTVEALLSMHAVDVRTTGAKGDGKEMSDGAMTSLTVLTSATAAFVSNDVGKIIEIKAADPTAPAPPTPTLTANTLNGTLPAGTWRYIVTAVNESGQTLPSTAGTVTTTGATSRVRVNWVAQNQALRYRIYRSPVNGGAGTERFIMQIGDTSWTDRGVWAISGGATAGVDTVPTSATMRLWHTSTIASVQSATQITMAAAAAVTVASGATFVYGTDDTAAIQAAMSMVPAEGARVAFPGGIFLISAAIRPKTMTMVSGQHATRYSIARSPTSRCKLLALSTWNTATDPGMIMPSTVVPPGGGSSYAGAQIEGLCLAGNGMGAGLHGFRLQDYVGGLAVTGEQAWVVEHVTVSGFTGCAIYGAMWVFTLNDVFLQLSSAWGYDTGSTNAPFDTRWNNVWVTYNESGGIRLGNIDVAASIGGANTFGNMRIERNGNMPNFPLTPVCKSAPGLRVHQLTKTAFIGVETDANTGNGLEFIAPPASLNANAIIGITLTDLQTNRDGGGDQVTMPVKAGLWLQGYRSGTVSQDTEGTNHIKVTNHINTRFTSDDTGATGIFTPAFGVHVEIATNFSWANGWLTGSTNAWDLGSNNYGTAIQDPHHGITVPMAQAGLGGGINTGNAPVGYLALLGGAPAQQPQAQTSWYGAVAYLGFELLGSIVLGSAANTTGDLTIQPRDEIMIWFRIASLSLSDTVKMMFNGDGGGNYWWRHVTSVRSGSSGSAPALIDTFAASATGLVVYPIAGTAQVQGFARMSNMAAKSKLAIVDSTVASGSAATVPTMQLNGSGEWVNTSAQITTIRLTSSGGGATLAAGSGFAVWGRTL